MGSCNPLYRVRVSSSGLIYAVIVGAWAAYLVPMWLRRQDELNEARPTERFSTAIRLLSGKAAMERRYAKDAERREAREARDTDAALSADAGPGDDHGDDAYSSAPGDAAKGAVDVRAFADPKTMVSGHSPEALAELHPSVRADADLDGQRHGGPGQGGRVRGDRGQGGTDGNGGPHPGAGQDRGAGPGPGAAESGRRTPTADRTSQADRVEQAGQASQAGQAGQASQASQAKQAKRAKLLARRRRTTMLLFLGFTVGAIVAAVGGLAFLWVPAAPAALLSAYIVHLRVQERRRFAFTMDRRRAEAAARHLHERRSRPSTAPSDPSGPGGGDAYGRGHVREPVAPDGGPGAGGDAEPLPYQGGGAREPVPSRRTRPGAGPGPEAAADRRALVEQTDHAEWVDQQRAPDREHPEGEGWEPVPVPLPTYVSAPVAPRTARDVDLEAPDAWSSARSSTAAEPEAERRNAAPQAPPSRAPRSRDRRTPLFDQYEEDGRPRAANE